MSRRLLLFLLVALPLRAQVVVTGFQSASSQFVYPADAAGAVGPQHVVAASNDGIIVQDRAGSVVAPRVSLAQFFSDPTISGGDYYDPRILYDATNDRWVLAALYDQKNHDSTLLVAVTDSGNPAGTWRRYRIATNPRGGDAADFTRMGMTTDRYVITANDDFGAEIWSVTKSSLYTGTPTVTNTPTDVFDLQPATFGDDSSSAEYLTTNDPSGTLDVYRLDGTLTHVGQFRSDPWEEPDDSEIAPQLGSGQPMDVGDTTVQAGFARAGFVWSVHPIVLDNPRRSSIRWWKVALDGSRAESGTVDDPSGATYFGFPSIAVNRAGGALIGYCVFRADIHPSAGFTYRDASGKFSAPAVSKYGDAVPRVTRWGDFTTTAVDPLNDNDFWITAPFGSNALWSTWWSEIRVEAAPPARVRAVRH
jgi:hypothetical protein